MEVVELPAADWEATRTACSSISPVVMILEIRLACPDRADKARLP